MISNLSPRYAVVVAERACVRVWRCVALFTALAVIVIAATSCGDVAPSHDSGSEPDARAQETRDLDAEGRSATAPIYSVAGSSITADWSTETESWVVLQCGENLRRRLAILEGEDWEFGVIPAWNVGVVTDLVSHPFHRLDRNVRPPTGGVIGTSENPSLLVFRQQFDCVPGSRVRSPVADLCIISVGHKYVSDALMLKAVKASIEDVDGDGSGELHVVDSLWQQWRGELIGGDPWPGVVLKEHSGRFSIPVQFTYPILRRMENGSVVFRPEDHPVAELERLAAEVMAQPLNNGRRMMAEELLVMAMYSGQRTWAEAFAGRCSTAEGDSRGLGWSANICRHILEHLRNSSLFPYLSQVHPELR